MDAISMEHLFVSEHDVPVATNKLRANFNHAVEPTQIEFMWGIRGINKAGVDSFNATDIGKVVWDTNFDLSKPEN